MTMDSLAHVSRLSTSIVCVFLILLSLCSSAHSLKCVVCDSYVDGEACFKWDGFSFVRDCSTVPMVDSSQPVSCQKITQVVDEVTSVVRQCSNVIGHEYCIDRVGHYGLLTRHCHCVEDICNTSNHLAPISLLTLCAQLFGLLSRYL